MPPTIVVLAAGASSRFGRPKPLEPIGPQGELMIDYLLFDARRAGIRRAVFVTQPEIGERLAIHTRRRFHDMELIVTYQPCPDEVAQVPFDRSKPLGTAHAVLAAESCVAGPFIAANADDFYGGGAIAAIASHLSDPARSLEHAVAAYPLWSTLSRFGGVSRATCIADDDGLLVELVELVDVRRSMGDDESIEGRDAAGSTRRLTGDERVSMNLWGFRPSIFRALRARFVEFAQSLDPAAPDDGEFLLSDAVGADVRSGEAFVRVLDAAAEWFGVTFKEDLPGARARAATLSADGGYPEALSCS